jgi:tripartite ATP-independent transporter DctM subunit
MIPPSLLMVLYGYFADVSIAKLFMAGFIPGILSALLFAVMIIVRVTLNPALAPPVEEEFKAEEKMAAVADVWPLPVLIVGVLAGIFLGAFTPTEGAAVGAALALVLAWMKRTLSWGVIKEASVSALSGTSSIFMVVIGTVLLAKMMALTGLPDGVAKWLLSFGSDFYTVVLMVVVLYLILGCFLDSISILLLTMPIVMPIARAVGADLIWFGVVLVKLLEIGLVTPPVGLNVYVMKSALGNLVPLTEIFRGVAWFVVTDLLTLTLIILFPWLSLMLPSMMK